ncbi:hypothetical protein CBR_g48138 [Chara braunii]|uniref:DUF8003 domain-containing protein n=1 Tax=Chara braunii TaxID=69332 RepID=A0A388M1Z9_CHABU|nr:hypothetical protein CBR_g48138 [Chara braunii]|eukprot:GBG88608.1 hypothetical protein CBR_g48138 [Chara braunii]
MIAHRIQITPNQAVIKGRGNLTLLPSSALNCSVPGCSVSIKLDGDIYLHEKAVIIASTLLIEASNVFLRSSAAISTKGLGGEPPPQTSGTATGTDGGGGGFGGRGASCSISAASFSDGDVWGGDTYEWHNLHCPWVYGSPGAGLGMEGVGGGGGGGRLNITLQGMLFLEGSIDSDGGDGADGGKAGGGGSGGSVFIKSKDLRGSGGRISAMGGNGYAGGGGGRIAIDCPQHDNVVITAQGGGSLGCPQNSGSPGTVFNCFSQALNLSNFGMPTRTSTPLYEFPNRPLYSNFSVLAGARVVVLSLWSRVQVREHIDLNGGYLKSGVPGVTIWSDLELVANGMQMCRSEMEVYGSLKLAIHVLELRNSSIRIDGGFIGVSTMEVNRLQLEGGSSIVSDANLGVHGQGILKIGPDDRIAAQKLFVSLYSSLKVGLGGRLEAPLTDPTTEMRAALYCSNPSCPPAVIQSSQDCSMDVDSPFTLQICRVEEITVAGTIAGSIVHFQRAKTVTVTRDGALSSSGRGCGRGEGVGKGDTSVSGAGGGGGHGGRGGYGCYNGSRGEGGGAYGSDRLPCELGSGSGLSSSGESNNGGGVIVFGGADHPVVTLTVDGELTADGGDCTPPHDSVDRPGGGGGSGGSILLFLQMLKTGNGSVISCRGGRGCPVGGGGGAGGRIHFEWAMLTTGEDYILRANASGSIDVSGGNGSNDGGSGDNGTLTTIDCPLGLFGVFCEECPVGTYKDTVGSNKSLCRPCPRDKLPVHGTFTHRRGGVMELPCPYKCINDKYSLPHCNTPIQDLIEHLGGATVFATMMIGVMLLLALALSVARMKFVSEKELDAPTTPRTPDNHPTDHSAPFLESLNEVMNVLRVEEPPTHMHRVYFMGSNSFSEPWHLPHSPPDQILDIVFEDAYNRFAEEINTLAAFQWWEGCVYGVLCVLCFPFGWSWQQWRRRMKLLKLQEFAQNEYDHACLRSCRSRALYEGIKVSSTPDLILAYVDLFLGGDEKRADLPPKLHERLPMAILFGGAGTYMAPFHLHSDDLLTRLISEVMPSTRWYRLVAGLNAQLRTVRRGCLRRTLVPVITWLNSYVNPFLSSDDLKLDLAWFQATESGYYQLGLILDSTDDSREGSISPPSLSPRTSLVDFRTLGSHIGSPAQLPPHSQRSSISPPTQLFTPLSQSTCMAQQSLLHSSSLAAQHAASSSLLHQSSMPASLLHQGSSLQQPLMQHPDSKCLPHQMSIQPAPLLLPQLQSLPTRHLSLPLHTQLSTSRRRSIGCVIDQLTVRSLEDRASVNVVMWIMLRNTRPIGHHAAVGMVMSMLLLADVGLSFLTVLELYSMSFVAFVLVLLILPLTPLFSVAAGLNALFSHGPRKAAALGRVYGLWNATSVANVMLALLYGFFQHNDWKGWGLHRGLLVATGIGEPDEEMWWLFPSLLLFCKFLQSRVIDRHVANLEIQDRTLYAEDPTKFWEAHT